MAILLKRFIIPFIPQSARQRLKQRVVERAFTLEDLDIRSKNVHDEFKVSGINLLGYARAEMGLGESCRLAARSLETTHINYGILNFKGTNSARMTDTTWSHKEIDNPKYNINIFHINAEQMIEVYTKYGHSLFKERYNIGYWHWELPEFPDEWVSGFNFVNEVWVPSQFVADSVAAKSDVPVVIIPHGIEVTIMEPRTRLHFNLPENAFLFLTMYDMNSYQERKNPMASIKAFKASFKPDDQSVGLVVKVNNAGSNKEDIRHLASLVEGYSNIYIIKATMSRNDTYALLSCTDSFISLHRSEGFGLGLAEAMYLGKPAIGTNWSANIDFMTTENSCLVDYDLQSVGKDYGPYKAHQTWANPHIEHASEYMKKLVQQPEYYRSVADKGQSDIKSNFSPSMVGSKVEQRLKTISEILGGKE